jgi:N-acetylated-alpha-linked acidic dipeptidase
MIRSADVVVSATAAPHAIITRDLVLRALPEGPDHPMLIVDIALPRDVEREVGEVPNVFLYDVDDLRQIVSAKRDEIRERNRQIVEGVFRATSDPRRPLAAPRPEPLPPYLNFAPLDNAVDALALSAKRYGHALAKAADKDKLAHPGMSEVNALLRDAERTLTLPDGLPGRPWFQHQIYAPGVYTGYSVKTIPGVREAIEQKRWSDAEAQIVRAAAVLEKEAALVEKAAKLIGRE